MANELDELMNKDPLQLSARDIDDIIKYQRKQKADFDAGIKPKKGDAMPISLEELGLAVPVEPIKRRL